MREEKITYILFNEREKYISLIYGKNKEEATKRLYYYQDLYEGFNLIHTIYHSNSRHSWVVDFVGYHKSHIPNSLTGHSKKELKKAVGAIRKALEEPLQFIIYKNY